MATHTLKAWPNFFEAVRKGIKTFEIRKNDRGFRVGDILNLNEYDPSRKTYSGNVLEMKVTYLLSDPHFGLQDGYVVMGIVPRSFHEF